MADVTPDRKNSFTLTPETLGKHIYRYQPYNASITAHTWMDGALEEVQQEDLRMDDRRRERLKA